MQLNRKFLCYLFYFQLWLFNLLQKSTNVQNLCHHVTSCRGKEMSRKLNIEIIVHYNKIILIKLQDFVSQAQKLE